jgi:site-specific recombinase XerD
VNYSRILKAFNNLNAECATEADLETYLAWLIEQRLANKATARELATNQKWAKEKLAASDARRAAASDFTKWASTLR